ncbi:Alginate lyase [Roseomonas rosea]|uniref:Alginate lyase n=1 Tax=Muricoccus roseus TaxID=198092 RepID=A0A1M6NIK0_9PROT|nr:Alginate lyase [Roseomonas rosea]
MAPGREARRPQRTPPPPGRPAAETPARPPAAAGAAAAATLLGAQAALPEERRERRPLEGPFLPAPAATGEAAPCEERLPPLRNLEGFGYFLDPAFSRPDPKRLAMDQAAAKPLRDWLALVQRALARHRKGEAGAAACALEAMDHWARNGALLGAFNLQGDYHRAWGLAGAGLSFLALREAPGLEAPRLDRVARWLAAVARQIRPRHDRPSEALISDVRNNQAAWAGLAVAAAGVAAGERALLDWGVERLRNQLLQVDERGALPQELRRGAMALHYHLFAFDALAALERLAVANGIALTEAEAAAYRRLRDFTLAAAREPARIQALVGVAQTNPLRAPVEAPLARAPGLEIASMVMPDAESEAALAPFRPYASVWLGGEVTGWWKPGPRAGKEEAAPSSGPDSDVSASAPAIPPSAGAPEDAPPPPVPSAPLPAPR